MRSILFGLTVLVSLAFAPIVLAAGKARHVLVIVWDGMRPDFITQSNTPTLYELAHNGVRFENHHPVFLSTTEVNGTAIATGGYPGHDGIIANKEFRPEINSAKPIHTEDIEAVRKGDFATQGHYIRMPTVAEILRDKGMRSVVAGAKPVALLHDRAERTPTAYSFNLFAGQTLPPELREKIIGLHGAFPSATNAEPNRNDWTTSSLIDPLWANGVPEFSLLWMNQPDLTQHATGPGSPESLAAIRNADDNLARVLQALDEKGVRKQTDILLVSDHGFSTIQSSVDVAETLRDAGFKTFREFKTAPGNGDVLVVGVGGSVLLYVNGHDRDVTDKLVTFLQGWSYTGVIFTRRPVDGTFSLAQGHIDSPAAPDVLFSFRWTAERNDAGTPGMIFADVSEYGPGQGMHGSLSPYDMHNTFVASGPDFRSGIVDHLPTGNEDVAPTVLAILGIRQPRAMDGRVVSEAMEGVESKIRSFEPRHLEVTRNLPQGIWHQYLNLTEVNGVDYFDEGSGFQAPN